MSPFAGEHQMEKNELKFESRMSLIADYDELIERIKCCALTNRNLVSKFITKSFNPFFLPVAQDTLDRMFGIQLQSIVVARGKYLYKLNINTVLAQVTECKLLRDYEKLKEIKCLALPHMVSLSEDDITWMVFKKFEAQFLRYDLLWFPLNRGNAKACLHDFLCKAACCCNQGTALTWICTSGYPA